MNVITPTFEKRITPDLIEKLEPQEVFVFGSNESGTHGSGAARTALRWGAIMGIGIGKYGQTYAIPTKDFNIKTLPIPQIQTYVDQFISDAKWMNHTFLVTEIGCGLADYTPEDIAPLFKKAMEVENIFLPKRFWDILLKDTN